MRISKLRHKVFSATDMMRATWVCICRRSKLKLKPTGCQAAVSSRQTISTTLARIDSSMSVSSRRGPSLPSPPNSRSMIGGARPRSSCSTETAPSGSSRTLAT